MTKCQCNNCSWTGDAGATMPVRRLAERVMPGEPMPAGECPSCGALAHPARPAASFQTRAIWTATTDGDNCPLTTTVHWNEDNARERVIVDLEASGFAFVARDNMDTRQLCDFWSEKLEGACIIEPHAIEVEP